MNDTQIQVPEVLKNTSTTEQSVQDELNRLFANAKNAAKDLHWKRLFYGRIDRQNYLYGAVGSIALALLLAFIPFIGMLVAIVLLLLEFGMTVRRLHDINQTGWASLLLLIPFVGVLEVIYLCWKLGDTSANGYGPIPDPKREMFHAILNT
ncbi:MAG: hypothetical protein A2845_02395 [Candidatus Lloydbacteria bacterium RIFCSPHIGHO2_01_FULL_49_22]|uniref:DUF805 domain-containing protein n=1 Tax=Candidatus Lloydbacteria bacterium RIFCSPHIGHO2_01_FULL_49_22 TaxID=1798658 RepID=A0A1G2CUW7_9BACT|nr:MAG: hypothetical protein A2845_02395 [Candidatus Lloydbacteria bacterium RIFCSPHIGHO2_01_FULL_49_22]OGZ10298.1 MAG: hypothetical protein A3C14_02095 [Candidatus Lloydbacteria bacterium RIFCSPHIGHO2_02_FULL_50_18]